MSEKNKQSTSNAMNIDNDDDEWEEEVRIEI